VPDADRKPSRAPFHAAEASGSSSSSRSNHSWRRSSAAAAAARHGLAGAGADPVTGQPVAAAALRDRLLDHVYPALRDHGDTETVTGLLRRLEDRGTGAGRQRALFTSGLSTPTFITALARATLSGYEPGRQLGRCPGAGRGKRAGDLRKSSTGSSALT